MLIICRRLWLFLTRARLMLGIVYFLPKVGCPYIRSANRKAVNLWIEIICSFRKCGTWRICFVLFVDLKIPLVRKYKYKIKNLFNKRRHRKLLASLFSNNPCVHFSPFLYISKPKKLFLSTIILLILYISYRRNISALTRPFRMPNRLMLSTKGNIKYIFAIAQCFCLCRQCLENCV